MSRPLSRRHPGRSADATGSPLPQPGTAKDRITAEERALIDAAISEGRVQHVPTGISALEPVYRWVQPSPGTEGRLRQVFEAGTVLKRGYAWRRAINAGVMLARKQNY